MATTSMPRPRTNIFTCLACQAVFHTADLQRSHYVTDWHRYNLKRKVAGLPPVTSETFAQKVLQQQAQSKGESEKASFRAECTACNKVYYSENAYTNHLQSNKHKTAETKPTREEKQIKKPASNMQRPNTLINDSETSANEITSVAENDVQLEETDCIFCPRRAESFDANVEHMTKVHGFFIPEIEYLVDLRGLIKYLGEKVSIGNACLYCNGRGKGLKKSLDAVRKHMIDKGHCMIAYDTDEDIMEVVDFYDFSSSYPDAEWVDVDDDGNPLEDEDQEIPEGGELYEDDMELVLPSGARLGHRSLQRYFRQSIRPREERDSAIINRLITHHANSPGASSHGVITTSTSGQTGIPRGRQFLEQQRRAHFETRIGIKANKLQRHFRAQIL